MAARAEETIEVGSQNANATTTAKPATVAVRRSNRATKPTTRSQEKASRYNEEDKETGATEPTEKNRDGGAAKTYLQKILEIVAHSRTEIQDLKQMYEASKQEN